MDIIATFSEELASIEASDALKFKGFIENKMFGDMPEELLVALIKQMGFEDFIDYSDDVAKNGANNGTSGFIYHDELSEFFDKNKASIISFLKKQAHLFGENSAVSMVAAFNSMLKNEISADEVAEVLYSIMPESDNENLIVDTICWYCLEDLCYQYSSYQLDE